MIKKSMKKTGSNAGKRNGRTSPHSYGYSTKSAPFMSLGIDLSPDNHVSYKTGGVNQIHPKVQGLGINTMQVGR